MEREFYENLGLHQMIIYAVIFKTLSSSITTRVNLSNNYSSRYKKQQ